jgi:glycosyltransferase involved in cell wall biosynthesis
MILHLSTFHLEGGAGVAATRLHRALLHAGINSQMLTPMVHHPEYGVTPLAETVWQKRKSWLRFVGERLSFFPNEKDSSVRFAFSPAEIGADISEHPLVQQADILHLHWINFGFLSLHSLRKLFTLGKPVVWTLHDMWAFTGGCHYSRGCNHYLNHCQQCPYLAHPGEYDISFTHFEEKFRIYMLTKLVMISPSQWLTGLVQSASLTKSLVAQTIPNCIDTDQFKPKDIEQIRNKLKLPQDKKLLLFAGANTQDPRKGFTYFKEALKQVSEIASIEVLVFGKAHARNFEHFPVPVHYLGSISNPEDMVNIYNASDLIVVPSLEDNLPNTIMEAMACGTPAVGFKTGGISEMIDHQINGYLSDVKSSDSLTKGIDWVLDQNRNGSLSKAAREKVMESYSESVVAAQYNHIYNSLGKFI